MHIGSIVTIAMIITVSPQVGLVEKLPISSTFRCRWPQLRDKRQFLESVGVTGNHFPVGVIYDK